MAQLCLTLLGAFELRAGDRVLPISGVKTRALLAYLALHPGRPQTRDTLATLLWGHHGERRARQSLRQALFRLRRVLARGRGSALMVRDPTVTLERDAIDVDVARFERLVRRGGAAALRDAVALYQGPLLADLVPEEPAFDEWFRPERERLQELAREALRRLLRHHARRRIADAVGIAGRLLALDPLQEDVHRTLMRLYVRHGRRDAALRQYQGCVDLLRHELGVEPDAETKRLYRDILQQQPRTRAGAPSPVVRADTPLIGREGELAQLRTTLTAAERGRGRVALMSGESGVGKTRLVEELAAEAARRGARVLLGHCYETERVLPFRPWIDALRAGRVPAELRRLGTPNPVWVSELARLFPELAAAGPALPAATEGHVRLFEVLAGLLAHLAAHQPLLLIVEDAHWADDMSLRLFSFLGRRLLEHPILLMATAREEELEAAPLLRRVAEELVHEPHYARLTVAPLSEGHTHALVRALARRGRSDTRVAAVAAQAWTLSEGNPFVIVEMMRGLTDGGPEPLRFPPAVRDVVTARLERLSPGARQLAGVAATVGRASSFALLQRAAGLGEPDAAEGLEELVRCRMLGAVNERFDFTHHRVREVVYDTLGPPRRATLHGAVGRALERLSAGRLDEVCDQLAHHFARADEPSLALRYLLLLADTAARRYTLDDAVRVLREATGHADRLPAEEADRRRLDVTFRLAHVLSLLARVQEALDLLLKEQPRLEAVHDPSRSGRYHFWLAHCQALLGEPASALDHARRSVEQAARCGDHITMGQANYVLSREHYYTGQPLPGVAHGRQAVSLLDGTAERWWLGQARFVLALNLYHLGDFGPALEELERLRELAAAIGERRLQALGAGTAGWVHALLGDCTTGIAACRRVLAVSPDPITHAIVHGFLGGAYREAEDATAIVVLEETIREFRAVVDAGARHYLHLQAYFMAMLAEAYVAAGKMDEARQAATTAATMAGATGWSVGVGYAERARGTLAHATGAAAEAAACFDRAIAAFTACEARYHVARARLLRAEVAHARGDRSTAATELRAAHAAFRLLMVPRWVARAEEAGRRLNVNLA